MWLSYMDVVTLFVPNIVMKLIHTQYLEQCFFFGEGCAFETFAGFLHKIAVHYFDLQPSKEQCHVIAFETFIFAHVPVL